MESDDVRCTKIETLRLGVTYTFTILTAGWRVSLKPHEMPRSFTSCLCSNIFRRSSLHLCFACCTPKLWLSTASQEVTTHLGMISPNTSAASPAWTPVCSNPVRKHGQWSTRLGTEVHRRCTVCSRNEQLPHNLPLTHALAIVREFVCICSSGFVDSHHWFQKCAGFKALLS